MRGAIYTIMSYSSTFLEIDNLQKINNSENDNMLKLGQLAPFSRINCFYTNETLY